METVVLREAIMLLITTTLVDDCGSGDMHHRHDHLRCGGYDHCYQPAFGDGGRSAGD